MAITMTRAEYEKKYGVKAPAPTAVTTQPVTMTREQYKNKYETPSTPIEPTKPSFTQRIMSAFEKRDTNIDKQVAATQQGKQTYTEGVIGTAGEIAGGVGDIFFEALNTIPGVSDVLKKVEGKVATNETLQKAAQDYTAWKEANPRKANLLESSINIASILPVAAGEGALLKAGAKTTATVGGGAVELAGRTLAGTGRAVSGVGEVAAQSAITPTVQEAGRILAYRADKPFLTRISNTLTGDAVRPATRAQTAIETGLMGTEKQLGIQARRANQELWQNEIAPAVKSSTAQVTKEDLFAPIIKRINTTAEPGRKQALIDAFEAIQDDYKNISSLSLEEAQAVKRGLDEFTPDKVFKGKSVASEYATLKNDMANAIREKTYDSLSDVGIKKKYLDWANLKELEKIGVKALSESGQKGGFGTFWSSMYDKATVPIKTIGGQVLYRVGNILEFVGDKGLKTFGEFLRKKGYHVPEVAKDALKDQGGFVAIGNKAVKIPTDDLNVMSDLTDYVAGSYKPGPAVAKQLELDAARIAEKFGIKQPKTLKGLANEFGRELEKRGYKAKT